MLSVLEAMLARRLRPVVQKVSREAQSPRTLQVLRGNLVVLEPKWEKVLSESSYHQLRIADLG